MAQNKDRGRQMVPSSPHRTPKWDSQQATMLSYLEGIKHSQINHFSRESIQLAYEEFNEAVSYAMQYGRGISRNLCERFIRMYVNNDTIDMGDEGRKALEMLYQKTEMEISPIDIIR
jgi:predicted solute-binding protein